MTSGGTPTPKYPAQKGGYLANLFGQSYGAGGNYGNLWETPIGKSLIPAVGQLAGANPMLGAGVMAAGMGPSDWKTLMTKSTPGSARLGGFSRSSLNKFDQSQSAKPLAKYGEFLYKLGQELPKPPAPDDHNLKPLKPIKLYDPSEAQAPSAYPSDVIIEGNEDNTVNLDPTIGSKYYQPDPSIQRAIDSAYQRVPVYGGWSVSDTGQPVYVPGGSGGGEYLDRDGARTGESIPLSDWSHPVTNNIFFNLSRQLLDAGQVKSTGASLGRFMEGGVNQQIPTEADLAEYLAGHMRRGGKFKNPRYQAVDEQGQPQRGNYLRTGPHGQGQRQEVRVQAPDFRTLPAYQDRHEGGTTGGTGYSSQLVDPDVVARLRAREIYPHYKKWLENQKTGGAALQTAVGLGRNPGSQATWRPLETYADDLPSLLMGSAFSGFGRTGSFSLAGEGEPYYGSQGGHRLMAMDNRHLRGRPGSPFYDPTRPLRPYEQVVNERLPQNAQQRGLELLLDAFSPAKNWGNYEMGMHLKGDPRWFLRHGMSAPRHVLKSPGYVWNAAKGIAQPAATYASQVEKFNEAYNAYKSSLPAGKTALTPKVWAARAGINYLNPVKSVLMGMGFGSPAGYAPQLAGPMPAGGPNMIPRKPIPWASLSKAEKARKGLGLRQALSRNWNVLRGQPLPKGTSILPSFKMFGGTGAPSRLGQATRIGGRALAVADGLRVLFQGPIEELIEMSKDPNYDPRKRGQGRWGEYYRTGDGLVPRQGQYIDADGDGILDRDDAGNLVANPNAGKAMIGPQGYQIEMNEGLNKYLQKVMKGVEEPDYAIQEFGASALDAAGWAANKLGLADNPQWGRLLSDPTTDRRFGIDLSEKKLPDNYIEGTHANLTAELPNVERALKERLGQINPETAVLDDAGQQIGGFYEPSAEEIKQDLPTEQLAKFLVATQQIPVKGGKSRNMTAEEARGLIASIPLEDREKAYDVIGKLYTPDGRTRVQDEQIAAEQELGYLRKHYGGNTLETVVRDPAETDESYARRRRNAPALMEVQNEDGTTRRLTLSELPNSPPIELPDGRYMGRRDYELYRVRENINKTFENQLIDTAKDIYARGQGTVSPDLAMRLATRKHGEHRTLRSRILAQQEANLEGWNTDNPNLTREGLREQLQAQITEMSPYRPEAVTQDMLSGHESSQRAHLQELRQRKADLPSRIEAARDVTKNVSYSKDTVSQVAAQRREAMTAMSKLKQSVPEDPEELREWNRALAHNQGIVDAANNFDETYGDNMEFVGPDSWGLARYNYAEENTRDAMRKQLAGVGEQIRKWENYSDKDKTADILENISRNKGRRAMWDALKKVIPPTQEEINDRRRRGWEAIDNNMR
tara:strand:- start:6667 stop:10755 length:4089 start_codon:yes stop_codon:yes gene_type:complete